MLTKTRCIGCLKKFNKDQQHQGCCKECSETKVFIKVSDETATIHSPMIKEMVNEIHVKEVKPKAMVTANVSKMSGKMLVQRKENMSA